MKGTNTKHLVMVADDDLFVRKVIRAALEGQAEIIEVTDGAEVQKLFSERTPDVLFLDLHLPNILGSDLIQPLLKVDKGAYIVMMSADSSADNVKTSQLRGSRGFLTKPFDKKRILQIFNACPSIKPQKS